METLTSRHTFKKLGTILEHILKNIDLSKYQVSCSMGNFRLNINIWPITYQTVNPLWTFVWNNSFNGKLTIGSQFLHIGAEW